MFDIRRRDFITLLGGTAAWPLGAGAQQAGKLPTIGFLGTTTPSAWSQWVAAFVQRLRDFGWIEGRAIAVEYRWAEGRDERFVEIAAEFVQLKVDVIVTSGTALLAAKQATSVSQSCLPWRTTQLAAALSQVCRDRAATSLAYRSSRPILLASASNCSARLSPTSAGWRSWPMSAILAPCLNWPRFRRPPARSALRSLRSKSGERRISPPPSRRSTAAWTHFISRPMRSYPPTGFASTPWHADDAQCAGVCRSGRSDVLWSELHGPVPARRGVSRQDFAWGEARRHPRRTADQIRSCNQSDHREGARPRNSTNAAGTRRRGDRMKRREFMTLLGSAAAA